MARNGMLGSALVASLGIAAGAQAGILQGIGSINPSPGVRIDWSSDFGVDPVGSLWTNFGPHTGYSSTQVEGWGPGYAHSSLSIDCPAPQTTPGSPTVIHSVLEVQNYSGVYGLYGTAGLSNMAFLLDQSYPTIYYYAEWSFNYENLGMNSGTGSVLIWVNQGWGTPVHSGAFGVGGSSGTIQGTSSGSQLSFGGGSELYQGQAFNGAGRLTTDIRIWVSTSPIPAPGAAGLLALGGVLGLRRRRA